MSYLSIDETRQQLEAGPEDRLSKSGHNLPNVVQYLKERPPDRLEEIFSVLRQRIPRLERVEADPMPDGRLLLQIKDAPFEQPVLSKFASDGTLKMLAYLTLLYDREPPCFIGIEEPENFLHPRLLPGLAEECQAATARSQLLIASHSPFLLNVMQPEEVRVLYRDEQGFTRSQRACDIQGIPGQMRAGASYGPQVVPEQQEPVRAEPFDKLRANGKETVRRLLQVRITGALVDGRPFRPGQSTGQPGSTAQPRQETRLMLEKLVVFVEEESMEAALEALLPRLLGNVEFQILRFQCKDDLLSKLPHRLEGYASWLPEDWVILVLVDRDDEDCPAAQLGCASSNAPAP